MLPLPHLPVLLLLIDYLPFQLSIAIAYHYPNRY